MSCISAIIPSLKLAIFPDYYNVPLSHLTKKQPQVNYSA